MADNGRPDRSLRENLADSAVCGLLLMDRTGSIVEANTTFLEWTGATREDLGEGLQFLPLLRAGDRIYWETHIGPLLDMQGQVSEIAVELEVGDGLWLPVLLSARALEPANPESLMSIALFSARDRRSYEQELLASRRMAEQAEDTARELSETLQRTLVPPRLPEIAGLDVGAAFRPAGESAEIGGDFYDVFQVGSSWMVVVGDICGKGAAAAALTSLVRYTIRGAALETSDLTNLLGDVNTTLLQEDKDEICTVLLARVDMSSSSPVVQFASAGHPLPRLVTRMGDVRTVGSSGTLLGAFEDARQVTDTVQLARGDSLVMFTDGVSEARKGEVFFGEGPLDETLADLKGIDAAIIADRLANAAVEFEDGSLRDDAAIVVISPTG